MSMEDFLETVRSNTPPSKDIRVPSRAGVSSQELLDASNEDASRTADVAEGLRWGHTESNIHSGGALMAIVNFCAHAIGLGVKGHRSHDTRDDFTIR